MAPSNWQLTTRTGLKISVRAASLTDGSILDNLFHHVCEEDLRFRFLSGMKHVSPERIREMTNIDHRTVETFIAFLNGSDTAIAVGTLAASATGEQGEVAISVHAEYRNVGVGWELLSFIAEQAKSRGIKLIQSIESRANHDAIELERNMGFKAEPFPGESTLVIVSKTLS